MKVRGTSASSLGHAGDPRSETNRRQELNTRFRAALTGFFLKRVHDRAEAEDLTQEVFLRLMEQSARSSLVAADAYVFTIATNLLRDRARRASSHRLNAHFSLDHAQADAGPALVEQQDPERILQGRESLRITMDALARLDERTRNIFVLFRLEHLKQREIAEMYGMSVAAVEKQVRRATLHLVATTLARG